MLKAHEHCAAEAHCMACAAHSPLTISHPPPPCPQCERQLSNSPFRLGLRSQRMTDTGWEQCFSFVIVGCNAASACCNTAAEVVKLEFQLGRCC